MRKSVHENIHCSQSQLSVPLLNSEEKSYAVYRNVVSGWRLENQNRIMTRAVPSCTLLEFKLCKEITTLIVIDYYWQTALRYVKTLVYVRWSVLSIEPVAIGAHVPHLKWYFKYGILHILCRSPASSSSVLLWQYQWWAILCVMFTGRQVLLILVDNAFVMRMSLLENNS